MKKLTLMITALLFCAIAAQAAMDDRTFPVYVTNTTSAAQSYVLRGQLESIVVDIPAGTTCTVVIADSYSTLFSKSSISADSVFYPRYAYHNSVGANLGTNVCAALAGPITVTVTGGCTNNATYDVKLIYSK